MIIGIDASRAFIDGRTGTENYSYHVIREMIRLPEAKLHTFVLFIRPNTLPPEEFDGYSNVMVKVVNWRYLWTQLGLAWETWQDPHIDVLWVPAHTLPILRKPSIKTVVTIHGLEYQWLPEYKNLLQRWYLPLSTIYATKHADALIAVSKFTADQLKKELHTSSKKIKVIHEGVDMRHSWSAGTLHSRSVLEKYGIEVKKYILFVGTIQPRKNLVGLIQAFSQLLLTHPGYKLVIAGGTGWIAEDIFKAPERHGVQEKVIFTGRVSDEVLHALYRSASVYVQPSLTEGFGLPLLEAMHAGVPVVTSDGGALSEVVGDAGLVVPLRDLVSFPARLAAAIITSIENSEFRAKLIANGKKRINELQWQKTAKETLKYLLTTGYK
jgi:glycosyltransferase involved in cell wall biosynthesis